MALQLNFLLADRGYGSGTLIEKAIETGCEVVIPPKKNRKKQFSYDNHIYKTGHLVENAFLHLKRWQAVATRYAKTITAFVAAVQIRCTALWLKVLI